MYEYKGLGYWYASVNGMWNYWKDYGDADLIYKGYTFNMQEVNEMLYEQFEDECANYIEAIRHEGLSSAVRDAFSDYMREHGEHFLDELIANGYFQGNSKSWHDKM